MLTHLTETHQEEPTASVNSSSGFIQTTKKKKMSSSSGDKGQLVRAEARIQENPRTPTETLLNMVSTLWYNVYSIHVYVFMWDTK